MAVVDEVLAVGLDLLMYEGHETRVHLRHIEEPHPTEAFHRDAKLTRMSLWIGLAGIMSTGEDLQDRGRDPIRRHPHPRQDRHHLEHLL